MPDFGWRATAWGVSPAAWHAGFAFGLISGQSYDWRLDMSSSSKGRLTTQSLGTFVAPGCVLGASDEKNDEDVLKDVMGIATGALGDMTDEEVARFMADLRAKDQNGNSDNDKPGDKIASAGFAPSVLAADNTPAQNFPQNSANNPAAIMLFALLAAAALSVWFLLRRFNK